ncbi:hypothetical protein MJO28_006836 [Puccinia striiformis f. sp. tritici]|uniref:Uncharacterized protein n=1 Tax=Puccinia striiformis f. sp. tritici TaxID=168172 RepID=A0ACC0EJC7_9BASI|nr:hypothetical protein MJO28_006836 [Puccinia striiformis f. sp. tritici]
MRLGFRTPGKAILIALWLSKNVMNAPNYGRARFTTDTETYPMDGEDMAYGYFFDKDERNFKSFAKMAPGAGQGVFTSTLTNSKSRVNMGNVFQRVIYDSDTMRLETMQPEVQIYQFSPASHDLAVVFDERLLLMLACQHADKDQGKPMDSRATGHMLLAGEHPPPTTLVPVWYGFIPRDEGVESVEIEVTLATREVKTLKFSAGTSQKLDDASAWQKFRLVAYKLEEQPSIRLSFK